MKIHTRKCANPTCSNVLENTRTNSPICFACITAAKAEKVNAADRALLEGLYTHVTGPSERNKNGKLEWTFTHAQCGTRQTWVMGNIKKRLKADPSTVPCSACGGKRRAARATEVYVEKYGRTYDLKVFQDYSAQVRYYSNKTFAENQEALNPLGLERSMTGHHLDHRVPVVVCFLEGIPVAVASSAMNLQLLPAAENLSKCRSRCEAALLAELKRASAL